MNYISAYKTNPEQPLSCPGLFILSAVAAAAAVMSMTGVPSVSVLIVMVSADRIRIIQQGACQQGGDLFVRLAGYSRIQGNSRLRQSCTGAAADTAADQCIHAVRLKKSSQSPVAAASGIHNLGRSDLSVGYRVDFKLSGMSEMLEYLSVLISDCDFHRNIPFFKLLILIGIGMISRRFAFVADAAASGTAEAAGSAAAFLHQGTKPIITA